jgi:hypothetical protein
LEWSSQANGEMGHDAPLLPRDAIAGEAVSGQLL